MIEQMITLGVQVISGIAGVIRAAGLSAEAQRKHLDDLYARLDATRQAVHAEAEETRKIAEDLHG